MRVLVTGAAGFVGTHTVRRLTREGHEAVALAHEFHPEWDVPVARRFAASVTDSEAVSDAVRECDAVVHLAALLPQRRRPPAEMRETNVEGTRTVVDAAKTAGVRRFVFCSSAEVYGVPALAPIPEDGPLAPNGEYGRNKVEAERIVRESGLPWVILRPPTIVGPGMPEPLLTGMVAAMASGKTVIVPGGDSHFQMVDVEDVVEAIVLALTSPQAPGGTFNLGADDVPTGRLLAEGIRDRLGSRSRIVCVPAWLAKPLLHLLVFLRRPLLEPEHVDIAFAEYTFDTSRAKKILGWRPGRTQLESFVALAQVPRPPVTPARNA